MNNTNLEFDKLHAHLRDFEFHFFKLAKFQDRTRVIKRVGGRLFTAHSKVGEEDHREVKGEDPLTVLRLATRETKKVRDWLSLQGQAFRFPRQTHTPHTYAPTQRRVSFCLGDLSAGASMEAKRRQGSQ